MTEQKIKICCGRKCSERGAVRILEEIQNEFGSDSAEMVECMDYCERAPNVIKNDKIYHECRGSTIVKRLKVEDGVEIKEITLEDINLEDELL